MRFWVTHPDAFLKQPKAVSKCPDLLCLLTALRPGKSHPHNPHIVLDGCPPTLLKSFMLLQQRPRVIAKLMAAPDADT